MQMDLINSLVQLGFPAMMAILLLLVGREMMLHVSVVIEHNTMALTRIADVISEHSRAIERLAVMVNEMDKRLARVEHRKDEP